MSAIPGETRTPEIVSFQSCCIPCLENDTAFGICCRLHLFGLSVHYNVASQLAEWSRLRAEQCEETRYRSWTLLRCQLTFSSSLMVSVAVSKLGCTELFFVEPGWKWTADTEMMSVEDIVHLCQKLPKSVDVRWSYSVQYQCRFWDTVYIKFPSWFLFDLR